MNFDVVALCGAVVGAMFILLPMKELKNEYFLFATAGLAVIVFIFSIKNAKPLFDYIGRLSGEGKNTYFKILTKVLGISIITGLTSEFALDLGMKGVSGKIEFAGKVAVLLSALPVYDELFTLVYSVL
jgi:stage III sporulation protein AD